MQTVNALVNSIQRRIRAAAVAARVGHKILITAVKFNFQLWGGGGVPTNELDLLVSC